MARRIISTEIKYGPVDEYTPDEVEELCCEPDTIDPCVKKGEKVEVFGNLTEEELIEKNPRLQDLIASSKINPLLEVRYASRQNPCGEKITKYRRTDTCCADGSADPLIWDSFFSLVQGGRTYRFCIKGGTPDYEWTVSGSGLSITGSGECAILSVSECFCLPGSVTVTDGCGETVTTTVDHKDGYWDDITWSDDLPLAIGYSGQFPQSASSSAGFYGISANQRYKKYQVWKSVTQPPSTPGVPNIGGACTYENPSEPLAPIHVTVDHGLNGHTFCGIDHVYILGDGDPWPTDYVIAYYPVATSQRAWEWKCPDFPPELLYDDDASADTIADNSFAYVSWDGGKPPFLVSVGGVEVYADPGKTTNQATTTSQNHAIYSGNACGPITVQITDSCGNTVSGGLTSTNGSWVSIGIMASISDYPQTLAIVGPMASLCTGLSGSTTISENDQVKGGYAMKVGSTHNPPDPSWSYSIQYSPTWGPGSLNCSSNPAFMAVYDELDPYLGLFNCLVAKGGTWLGGSLYSNGWIGGIRDIVEFKC